MVGVIPNEPVLYHNLWKASRLQEMISKVLAKMVATVRAREMLSKEVEQTKILYGIESWVET